MRGNWPLVEPPIAIDVDMAESIDAGVADDAPAATCTSKQSTQGALTHLVRAVVVAIVVVAMDVVAPVAHSFASPDPIAGTVSGSR